MTTSSIHTLVFVNFKSVYGRMDVCLVTFLEGKSWSKKPSDNRPCQLASFLAQETANWPRRTYSMFRIAADLSLSDFVGIYRISANFSPQESMLQFTDYVFGIMHIIRIVFASFFHFLFYSICFIVCCNVINYFSLIFRRVDSILFLSRQECSTPNTYRFWCISRKYVNRGKYLRRLFSLHYCA
jgi:hypothetical protein